jgi:hypothetical protein
MTNDSMSKIGTARRGAGSFAPVRSSDRPRASTSATQPGHEFQHLQWAEARTLQAVSTSVTTLRGGRHDFEVPAGQAFVSYVLRHSASGMEARSACGRACRLEPGGLLVCNGPGLVVQRSARQRGQACEAIDLLLPGVRSLGVFAHMDDCYASYINSRHACIRLLMGEWHGHRAMLTPLDDFWMMDIDLAPGAELRIPTAGWGAVVVPTSGSLRVDGRQVDGAAPIVGAGDAGGVWLESDTGASLVLLPQRFL